MPRMTRLGARMCGCVPLAMMAACGRAQPPDRAPDVTSPAQPQVTTAELPDTTTCNQFKPQWGNSTSLHVRGRDTVRATAEARSADSESFENGRVTARVDVVGGRLKKSGFDVAARDSFCVVVQGNYATKQLTAHFVRFSSSNPTLPGPVGVRIRIHQEPHPPMVEWIEEFETNSDGSLVPPAQEESGEAADTAVAPSGGVIKLQGSCGTKGCCAPKKAF